jgi:signal transduction histidine kinase
MKQLAEKIADAHSQEVIVQASPDVAEGLNLNKQTMIFMIAEEALTNARKHAQARHVWVRMARRDDLFIMEVEDDGVGFNLGAMDDGYASLGSLGLVNMRERAELINGLLEIASEPGRGTVVSLQVPLTAEAAEFLQRPGFVNRLSRTA